MARSSPRDEFRQVASDEFRHGAGDEDRHSEAMGFAEAERGVSPGRAMSFAGLLGR